jgi:serine/threonine protein phosphatase PrpC
MRGGDVLLVVGRDEPGPLDLAVPGGRVALVCAGRPGVPEENEDAAAVVCVGDAGAVLVVADGMGGLRGARTAAAAVVEHVVRCVGPARDEGTVRAGVVDGIEAANRAVIAEGLGGGATVIAAIAWEARVRTLHAGDAQALITGQRGRIKLETVAHSPVGLRRSMGMLGETAALTHEERHIVSNSVGDPDLTIEVGVPLTLAPRDTVVLGSDGLFDNLRVAEIAERVRTGRLPVAAARLRDAAAGRMRAEGQVSKPDDLTFILYRPA